MMRFGAAYQDSSSTRTLEADDMGLLKNRPTRRRSLLQTFSTRSLSLSNDSLASSHSFNLNLLGDNDLEGNDSFHQECLLNKSFSGSTTSDELGSSTQGLSWCSIPDLSDDLYDDIDLENTTEADCSPKTDTRKEMEASPELHLKNTDKKESLGHTKKMASASMVPFSGPTEFSGRERRVSLGRRASLVRRNSMGRRSFANLNDSFPQRTHSGPGRSQPHSSHSGKRLVTINPSPGNEYQEQVRARKTNTAASKSFQSIQQRAAQRDNIEKPFRTSRNDTYKAGSPSKPMAPLLPRKYVTIDQTMKKETIQEPRKTKKASLTSWSKASTPTKSCDKLFRSNYLLVKKLSIEVVPATRNDSFEFLQLKVKTKANPAA